MSTWKVILFVNIVLGLLVSLLWNGVLSNSVFTFKNWGGSLALISLLAAPVDLLLAAILFAFKKRQWAKGMLFSGLIFLAVLAIGYAVSKLL
jgi:hypothetical protein